MDNKQVTEKQNPYRVQTLQVSKSRKAVSHWVVGPSYRAGHYPTPAAAQAEADKLNASTGSAA